MADERFSWSRAGKENGSIELKRRNVWRILTKDSPLNCLVCGKRPKKNEKCYYPAVGLASTNKTIGHCDCVDALVEKIVAPGKSVPASIPAATIIGPGVAVSGGVPAGVKSAVEAGGRSKPIDWYLGWHAGVVFKVRGAAEASPPADATLDWFKGWYEGLTFIAGQPAGAGGDGDVRSN